MEFVMDKADFLDLEGKIEQIDRTARGWHCA
jgi:hypothetical protein